MAATYDSLRALSRQTMKKLLDVQEWRKFLAFASRSFKLPFPAQVLAYAQRPDAAALMKSSDWEAVYGRPVKKGCHGVPVPEGRGKKLVYYYDIADTRETDESRPVPLWHVRPENQKGIGKALESYLGKLEDASGFAETLLAAARKTVACTLDDRLDDLAAHSPGSLLEEMDSDNLLAAYRTMIENSVGYMLLSRCGLDPSPHFIDEDFYGLLDFNTPSTLTILGSAVTETAAMCLSVIAKAVRRMQAAPAEAERAPAVPKPALLQPVPEKRYTLQGGWELAVVGSDAESILYSFIDLPEQEPVPVSRKDFDQWLAAGFIKPAPAAIPA